MKYGDPEYKALRIELCRRAARMAVMETVVIHGVKYFDPLKVERDIEMWLRRRGTNSKKQNSPRAAGIALQLLKKYMKEEVYPKIATRP